METHHADVAVVGLGAIGSASLWRLADRGVSVVGIEQFTPGHDRGSSHGDSRLFRIACLEHPNLVTAARRSRELWRDLESLSGQTLLTTMGSVTIGPELDPAVRGALAAARHHGLDIEVLTATEIARRYPQHASIPEHHVGVIDPDAGVLRPEAAIVAAVDAARRLGAGTIENSRVSGIERTSTGVTITTDTSQIHARQAVVTAGAWLGSLVPELPLRSRRVMQSWFRPRSPGSDAFALDEFHVFIRALDDGSSYWGHGETAGEGVKIGVDWDPGCRWTDPDALDRAVTPSDYELVSAFVQSYLPDLEPDPIRVTPCMVTYTPDDQFVVGRPQDDPHLVVGGGGSGHAFKHAAGLGEAIAQITQREQLFLDPDFLAPDRFVTPG